ncbi:XdhC family protein [Pelagicoccus sp. SDUM812002]|uniref:XdhC family protein n=1 Tax=Pelagicoccus sp. SDUM812002 TaxID=3041266 RepID=UPI00280D5B29|nr:XdhC family protein [Pelagicoccus sp. SDUM812002]MDQ8187759.1 XdhC family protein [Pelagicoccus sp. SDUM812002]
MIGFWTAAEVELQARRRVFMAFVATSSKGSPGTPKARMLLREDGSQLGTIGGGIMELNLLQNATKALRQKDFPTRLQRIIHRSASENASGLICGGSQINVLCLFDPERDLATVSRIADALRNEEDAMIELSPSSFTLKSSSSTLSGSSSRLTEFGNDWIYQLSTVNPRRIAIFGAGHCGRALATQMVLLGYHVTLTDPRNDLPCNDRIGNVHTVIPSSASGCCRTLRHWELTAVVVMTHSYTTDVEALCEILPYRPAFLGLMGSPQKLAKVRRELSETGLSEEQIASLRAPVGLAIGSDTPEEIAVSIAAQLLQENNLNSLHEPDYADHVST